MSKKRLFKPEINEIEQKLSEALAYYRVGNFYKTRKLARFIKNAPASSSSQKAEALKLLKMTGIDFFTILAGVFCLALTATVAFASAY